ncbi:MAG TPA: nucleotide exchange factor GrpE [Rhodobacteraceae bacterium]|jgi:molecular chaperone GrpE|nr:nucleotide exchange factor GrpE [Paracoccaceae bacterium]HBG97749.1 nucleotide exchange factor GrpE [Paracoccaceae bacterium]
MSPIEDDTSGQDPASQADTDAPTGAAASGPGAGVDPTADDPNVDGPDADSAAAIAALEAERESLKDRLLRALAEAENARKRGERDRREAQDYGATRLARDLLPVYDNLRRALDAMGAQERAAAPSVVEGIELTLREMLAAFGRHGIRPAVPEPGDPFDPQRHEAMFEAPVADHAPGSIIQVMTEGFTIHDRLLRPAQVGVASGVASVSASR